MKKLLGILGTITIAGGGISGIIGNAPAPAKNEINYQKEDKIFKKINGVDLDGSFRIANNKNIYFGTSHGAYVLKRGETTANKIDEITSKVYSIIIDGKDNVYFGTENGAYILKQKETIATKINGITDNHHIHLIAVDNSDNVYIGTRKNAFILKQGTIIPSKINGINTDDNENLAQIVIDFDNNVFFRTYVINNTNNNYPDNSVYILKKNKIAATRVHDFLDSFWISSDNQKNIYFKSFNGHYVLNNSWEIKLNQENELFEKWTFLEHDKLKIRFNFDTVNEIKTSFLSNKKEEFMNKLKLMINNIPKSNHSATDRPITSDDINVIINFIWEHFSYFNEKILSLKNNQTIIIETNTIGYWDNIDSNNNIYIN